MHRPPAPNLVLYTSGNNTDIDSLRAANPGKCCIPLPPGNISGLSTPGTHYISPDVTSCQVKIVCPEAFPLASNGTYAVYTCGCKGGGCDRECSPTG